MERFPCACCGGEDFKQIDDGMFECVNCGTIFFARETDGFEVHLVNGNTPEPVENEVVVAYDDTDDDDYDDYDSQGFSDGDLDDPVELQVISSCVGNELDWDDADAIRNLLLEGRKLEAIKQFRELCGCGLKEAKESIDEYCGIFEDDDDDDSSYTNWQPPTSTETKSKNEFNPIFFLLLLLGPIGWIIFFYLWSQNKK